MPQIGCETGEVQLAVSRLSRAVGQSLAPRPGRKVVCMTIQKWRLRRLMKAATTPLLARSEMLVLVQQVPKGRR